MMLEIAYPTKYTVVHIGDTYLDTCFSEVYLHGNLFTRVDVWIMCLLERPLQFFELCGCESSSDPPLFPFLRENSIVVVAGINFVR